MGGGGWVGGLNKLILFSTQVEVAVELKLGLKLVTTSQGRWWVGGWTKIN